MVQFIMVLCSGWYRSQSAFFFKFYLVKFASSKSCTSTFFISRLASRVSWPFRLFLLLQEKGRFGNSVPNPVLSLATWGGSVGLGHGGNPHAPHIYRKSKRHVVVALTQFGGGQVNTYFAS